MRERIYRANTKLLRELENMLERRVGLGDARLVIILVEALAIFAPKPSCVDHALKKDARTILRVPSTGIECFLDCEASVEADTRIRQQVSDIKESPNWDRTSQLNK